MPLSPVTLAGRHVRLEPLSVGHLPGLLQAASESRATFTLTSVPGDEAAMRAYIDYARERFEAAEALPFATVDVAKNRVVGSTRFAALERWAWPAGRVAPAPAVDFEVAEIGWTWLAPSAQRTPVNTEAKLLMLTHAFETWKLRRVLLKTDARNSRSRAAIERLGARFDGILRAHMPSYDGGVRDSAFYSILAAEWPEVRERLRARLER
ncbi:MAG TPA: GNAT family protein [Polyangiaceae bacterium]